MYIRASSKESLTDSCFQFFFGTMDMVTVKLSKDFKFIKLINGTGSLLFDKTVTLMFLGAYDAA